MKFDGVNPFAWLRGERFTRYRGQSFGIWDFKYLEFDIDIAIAIVIAIDIAIDIVIDIAIAIVIDIEICH